MGHPLSQLIPPWLGWSRQVTGKAPAWVGSSCKVCSSMGMAVAHARPGELNSVGLCRFDRLTPIYISIKFPEKGLYLLSCMVAYTYYTVSIPLRGSFRRKRLTFA